MTTLLDKQKLQLSAMKQLLKTKSRQSDRIYLAQSIKDLEAKMGLVKSTQVKIETEATVKSVYKNTKTNNFRPIL